jgi:hypothetical protein
MVPDFEFGSAASFSEREKLGRLETEPDLELECHVLMSEQSQLAARLDFGTSTYLYQLSQPKKPRGLYLFTTSTMVPAKSPIPPEGLLPRRFVATGSGFFTVGEVASSHMPRNTFPACMTNQYLHPGSYNYLASKPSRFISGKTPLASERGNGG